MELRHLRYFVAVAEEENFHRAAEKLHVSQSPLSRQMQQLKEEVGVDLFEPSGRGVKLALAGRLFLERAKAILSSVDVAVGEAREATDGRIGTIAIGFEPGSGYLGLLSAIVAKLRKRQPRVSVKLVPMTGTEQWEGLRLGEIGLAYGNEVPDDASLRSVVLSRTRLGIRLPKEHRLAKKVTLKVEDLADEPILMAPRRLRPRLYDDIIAAVRARGVVLNLAPDVGDGEAVWTLLSSGLGMTFAAESGARFLDAGRSIGGPVALRGAAVWRPLSNLGVELRDVAIWRADAARSPLLRPLIDIVGEVRTEHRSGRATSKATAMRSPPRRPPALADTARRRRQ
jgi:LysR family transcriptional regulator, benzoate and cis,cis-muconate-responsive activator of ben and cat genes